MPPFDGPRAIECWTRYPWKTRMAPLSMRTGTETMSCRFGFRSRSRTPGSSPRWSAARSNCFCAISYGFRDSASTGLSVGAPRFPGAVLGRGSTRLTAGRGLGLGRMQFSFAPLPAMRRPRRGRGFARRFGSAGDVEGERFEVDPEIDVLEICIRGSIETDRREVENRLQSGIPAATRDRRRRVSRHRDDRDLDALPRHELAEPLDVVDRHTGAAAGADSRAVVVEERDASKSFRPESAVVRERLAEPSGSHDCDAPGSMDPENR